MSSRVLASLLCLAVVAACAAPAGAAVVNGAVTDPAGGRVGGADIRTASVAYDTNGAVSGTVVTRVPTFNPVAGFEVLLGKASKRRGFCATEFQEDISAVEPGGELAPFGRGTVGGARLGFHDVQQNGPAMAFSTTAGDFETPPRGNQPVLANKPWNCAVVVSLGPGTHRERKIPDVFDRTDDTGVFPLVAGPPLSCDIAARTSRGRIRARCANADGPVTVRVHLRAKVRVRRMATIVGGRLSASARGMRRKRPYIVSIWRGETMVAAEPVRRR